MNYNFLKVFFLQSNNAIDGIGAVILYTALVIVIFRHYSRDSYVVLEN